ncbi:MAG: Lrp/AsnC family transcriptional regulator [DPANN group archaeon]|nr:Lrp/AsnC family transcriptional regulator [DPANN group archaeon]
MLDDIDKQIIGKLAKDGRLSLTNLSNGMDISRVAIATRIDKLIESGILKISASLNLDKLNYQTLIVEMQVPKKQQEEFRKVISVNAKVLNCFEVSGQYNYLLICSAKNNNTLRHFIEHDLKRFADDCKVTLSSNPVYPEFVHLKHLENE